MLDWRRTGPKAVCASPTSLSHTLTLSHSLSHRSFRVDLISPPQFQGAIQLFSKRNHISHEQN